MCEGVCVSFQGGDNFIAIFIVYIVPRTRNWLKIYYILIIYNVEY